MIDHLGFRVRDLAAARRFYEAVAQALGLAVIDNTPESFLLASYYAGFVLDPDGNNIEAGFRG